MTATTTGVLVLSACSTTTEDIHSSAAEEGSLWPLPYSVVYEDVAESVDGCVALLIPGYSHVHDSISAIGTWNANADSLCTGYVCYASSLLILASGIFSMAAQCTAPKLPAYMIGYYALTQLGIAIFATPHPLHNVFGLSSMPGYLAPLALAFTWRRVGPRHLIVLSYVLGLIVFVAIALGLSELFPESGLWQLVSPYPGLVQRLLVAAWLPWLIASGAMLRRQLRL